MEAKKFEVVRSNEARFSDNCYMFTQVGSCH